LTTEWEQYRAAAEKAFAEKDYANAEAHWRKARELGQSFDKYDDRVTVALEGLSETLWCQGQLAEAEQICNYVLHIFRVTRGPTHPDYGVLSNNVAMLCHFQGKHALAEQNYKRALEILGRTLGTGHAYVVAINTNYADLLRLMGRESEADQLTSKALVTSDLVHSGQFQVAQATPPPAAAVPDHTVVTTAVPGASSVRVPQAPLAMQQQRPEAIHQSGNSPRPQEIDTGTVAPANPQQAVLQNQLDGIPAVQGSSPDEKWENARAHAEAAINGQDWQKAEYFWQAAVRAAESFPIRDPRLCKSLESLAEVYWKQAKYGQAEPLSRRVLGIYEVVLGKNHPDVGFVANNLGMLYHAQGNLPTAATLYERALPLLVTKLGIQHPSVFNLETNLKNILVALGRHRDAEKVTERLLDAQQKRFTRSGKFESFASDAIAKHA
jgi:tetratricopeptide (TPR) repeat protein